MSQMLIVGFLVAYDYDLLRYSLPLVYKQASIIVLSIDENHKTWSGQSFIIENTFYEWLVAFDTDQKIIWVKADFADISSHPMANETRQRNAMFAHHPGYDWYIQLDADEYFLDFDGFCNWLTKAELPANVSITVKLKTIFKQYQENWFLTGGKMERVPIAMRHPQYTVARHNETNEIVEAPFVMLHQSWARTEEEIQQKISNWGHRPDFATVQFFRKWQRVNAWNYRLYRYFHPMHPPLWPYLEKVKSKSIPALSHHYQQHPPQELPVPALSWPQKILKKVLGI